MRVSDPADRFDLLDRLLDAEREAETEQNKLELGRLSPKLRESLGKSVTRLAAEDGGEGEGGCPLLALSRQEAGEELAPFHAMGRGDLVSVEDPTGRRSDATLYEVEGYRVLAAMASPLPERLPGGRWTVHRVGSDATYRRMKRALEDTRLAEKKAVARLRDVSFGLRTPATEGPGPLRFLDPSLNALQKRAVLSALSASDFALIHGPPGTGKTTALVEVIRQAVERGARVLAGAPSNVAVDNLLEKLIPAGLRVVRLGHPARTLESLRHATLAAQAAAHPDSAKVRELDRQRERLSVQRQRRAGRGRPDFDDLHARQREIRALWKEARGLEKTVSREILRDAQVVLTTHGSISKTLGAKPFDLAVLDEASQAVEPLSWIPLLQAERAVLAGDPLQLPPTLYSREAAQEGLALTLFERLQGVLPDPLKTMLAVQYRMHSAIMDFPSREFYGGRLEADASVSGRLLRDLPGVRQTPLTGAPFLFVDTSGTGWSEGWDELLQSRDNEEEARLTVRLLGELLDAGLAPREVAVITPYVAQVRRLKALLGDSPVEVGTVDGFQGREKEAVLLSLVRSNDTGEVGFLRDSRRMNVALTRAKRLLLVVGDGATVSRHPLYSRLLSHAEASGAHRSAWEWLQ